MCVVGGYAFLGFLQCWAMQLRSVAPSGEPHARVTAPSSRQGIDIGCGVGGSSRHILERYPGSKMTGITLSPVQAARAGELTAQAGFGSRAEFQVADALDQPFESGRFDLVWSLESGEHMPDKERFVREMVRVGKPGGKVVLVTWCHRCG